MKDDSTFFFHYGTQTWADWVEILNEKTIRNNKISKDIFYISTTIIDTIIINMYIDMNKTSCYI